MALNILSSAPLPRQYRVPLALSTSVAISVLSARDGVGLAEQGLKPADAPRGFFFGIVSASLIALALAVGPRLEMLRPMYRERAVATSASSAVYEVLLRIPLGTALPEELAFRGALLGRLNRGHRPAVACAISSLLFGLSHVPPSLSRVAGKTHASRLHRAAWVGSSVGLTSVAGFVLARLGVYSRSLVAPWMAHTAANSAGYVAARLARRDEAAERLSAGVSRGRSGGLS
jgi:membrane protease YdiL (CAAX protease family)